MARVYYEDDMQNTALARSFMRRCLAVSLTALALRCQILGSMHLFMEEQ